MSEIIQRKTTCTRDCPDACSMIATIEDGRVTRLQGDPEHPVTQGFLCRRTSRFPERQNSSDRLTTPLLRPSKDSDFEPVDWSTALDLVADKMVDCRNRLGGASILHYRCGGSLGIMKHVGDYFFERFGPVTVRSGDVCTGAGEAAQMKDFGCFESSDVFDLHHSRTIFLWGKNVFVSSIHLIPELRKARANGARIVLIDPIHNKTASIADICVQPRPGGDAAIAMGIARWQQDHDRLDSAASEYCDHYEDYCRLVQSRTVAKWSASADISVDTLTTLAEAYSSGPTCSMIGWGLQRRRHGATTVRAIDALAAVSGNLGVRGGGSSFYFGRRDAFDFSFSDPESAPRHFPEPLLARRILSAVDPPIEMAYIWGANPVVMLPDSRAMVEALRTRNFTVVVDQFMTDTAQCADLVLPTTTMLEEDDLVGAYGHHYIADVRPVVSPPPGVLSDHEIFRELSRRTGLAEEFDVEPAVWKKRLLKKMDASGASDELRNNGYVKNPFVAEVLFADRVFGTPSGNVNLLHKLPPAMVAERDHSGLYLTAISSSEAQGSQWPDQAQQGAAEAIIHPSAAVGHSDGDIVRISTRLDSILVQLRFDEQQRPDILLMRKGEWFFSGRCANALIEGELTDDGECAVYYDTIVDISSDAN